MFHGIPNQSLENRGEREIWFTAVGDIKILTQYIPSFVEAELHFSWVTLRFLGILLANISRSVQESIFVVERQSLGISPRLLKEWHSTWLENLSSPFREYRALDRLIFRQQQWKWYCSIFIRSKFRNLWKSCDLRFKCVMPWVIAAKRFII